MEHEKNYISEKYELQFKLNVIKTMMLAFPKKRFFLRNLMFFL